MTRVVLVPVFVLVGFFLGRFASVSDLQDAVALRSFLQQHFEQRAAALYSGAVGPALAAQIDPAHPAGRWLLIHEQQKAAHLHTWLRSRGYVLSGRQVEVKVLRVRTDGQTATASVIFRLGLEYRPADPAAGGDVDGMGVGTSHVVRLVRSGESWLVQRDYALDPLYETGPPPGADPRDFRHSPPAAAAGVTDLGAQGPVRAGARFDRSRAAHYADGYCGIAYGCANGHRYNKEYRDFTGVGGDCANFASQVLAAGGLRPGGGWRYDARLREASAAWINAGSLVRYLMHSGKAQLVARGTFAQVTKAGGGVGLPRLKAGDIIGYERNGDIVHVSVVAGTNASGYTVVNSHTADRYHVPWDLGWGENTRLWILHIRE